MSEKRWTLSGRTLSFDGVEIATLVRVTEPHPEISPSDLDDLAHEIAAHLNASRRVVKPGPHARFCQHCGDRNLNPAQRCERCNGAIMGPAFKSARKVQS